MRIATNRNHARPVVLHLVLALICAAGAFCSYNAQAMITVGPASDTACQYHDLGVAVQAAAQAPGLDLIAISGGPWTGQTTITEQDNDGLIIEGGFANCSAGVSTGRSTLDGQAAVPAGPLIVHSGNGPLTLLHLILQNGKGAIQSVVAGPLTLSDVLVYSNHADYGGGLFVSGNDIFRMQLHLISTSINSNSATVNGGGLYLSTVDVSITGGSNILGNIAQGPNGTSNGGGIYAIDSNILVSDHSVPPYAFIGNNYAQHNGGGVYYATSRAGDYEMLLWNDRASQPLLVSENAAQNQGGAFYISSISTNQQIFSFAGFENAIVRLNEAYEGAAIYAFSSGSGAAVGTQIQFAQSMPGDSIPACAVGLECNAIDDNHSFGGSVVEVDAGGSTGSASFLMYRGRMRGNRGGALIGGSAYMQIESSLLASNEISQGGGLIFNISNDLHIANSTIAYNTIAATALFTVILPPASLEILHSLFVQPTQSVSAYSLGTGVPVTVRDIGTKNVFFDQGTNVQNLSDPFVNGANGDFHISISSSAVNRWAPSGDPNDPPPTLDLDGATRPFSFNPNPTPYDFGAYEAGASVDVIFRNGFDP